MPVTAVTPRPMPTRPVAAKKPMQVAASARAAAAPPVVQTTEHLLSYCVWQVDAIVQGAKATTQRWLATTIARIRHTPVDNLPPVHRSARPGFVAARGQGFILDGKPFEFVGANCYDLLAMSDGQIDDAFKRMHDECGAQVVRFWAFQSYTKGATDFSKMDRVMAAAKRNGIKVIPVLEDQWETLTQGGTKTEAWYAGGYKQRDGNYPLSFEQYAKTVVSRYKDEPAIFSWMLMNEAECRNPATLETFTRDVAALVKRNDPDHMLTLGVLGGHQVGMDFGNYQRYIAPPTIDWAEYHDYSEDDTAMPGLLASRMADARAANKPLVVAEAGMSVTPRDGWKVETPASRAAKLDAKMDAYFKAGGVGYMVWDWTPNSETFVDFTTGDPLERVLKDRAAKLP